MKKSYLLLFVLILCCVLPACTKKGSPDEQLAGRFIQEVKKRKPNIEKLKAIANIQNFFPAHILVQENKLDILQQLYDANAAKLDVLDKNKESALFPAIRTRNSEAVQWLLEKDLDPVEMNSSGEKPLIVAEAILQTSQDEAEKQELNRIISLIKKKIAMELNSFETRFNTAVAQYEPNFNEISDLITRARERYGNEWAFYPVQYLLKKKQFDIVKNLEPVMLLNGMDENNETPLFWAVRNHEPDAVSWLLENNADREVANKEGKKAYQVAEELERTSSGIYKEKSQAIALLFREMDTVDYLKKAAFELLDKGIYCTSVEFKDLFARMEMAGCTFRQDGPGIISGQGKYMSLEEQQERDMRMYYQDIDSALLQKAVYYSCTELVKFMLKHESPTFYHYPVQYFDYATDYLLEIYAAKWDMDMVKMLVEGNYDLEDHNLDRALFFAVKSGNGELIDYLTEKGADPNYYPEEYSRNENLKYK